MDAGDFAAYNPGGAAASTAGGAWQTSEFLAGVMARLGYDVWTPGERELFIGERDLLKLAQDVRADVVSANLTDKATGKLLFKDSVIRRFGNIKIGVTGVTGAGPAIIPQTPVGAETDFAVKDAIESLKPIVAKLDKETDAVVVLAHVDASETKRIAEEIPGIDVLVAGHNPGLLPEPERVGDVLIIKGGNRGQNIGNLTLTFDGSKQITNFKGVVDPLNGAVKADTVLAAQIKKFQDDLMKPATAQPPVHTGAPAGAAAPKNDRGEREDPRDDRDQVVVTPPADPPRATDHFLGNGICARCHAEAQSRWAESPHARAWQTLVKVHREKDKDCVGCHVTGFGQPGGYEMLVVNVDGAGRPDSTDAADLRNVQCESCHGMGTQHGTPGLVKAVSREACVRCHDRANDRNFDYEKALAAVAHR